MPELLIRNGIVYDPVNGVEGEVMDVGVKDGRIVDASEVDLRRAKVIDATGMLVVPGGIDVHSHIAGPKVNTGRVMAIEDHYTTNIPFRRGVHAQTGRTVPNVYKIGYAYARMGFTTVAEAASPPLKTRHTHEELNAIPIIDKMTYILMDVNWIALDYMAEGDLEGLAGYVAWLLKATKGYAVKIVDPGADFAWLLGKGYGIDLDDQLPEYGLTPREIVTWLGKANELLKLPHPIHVHCNKLGYPGNYDVTMRTLRLAGSFTSREWVSLHVTHVQFTGYKGSSWATLASGGEDIAKVLNSEPHTSLDLGQIVFGRATTMTADAPFEHVLYHLTRWKWAFADVEAETAAGIVPYRYRRKNYVNTVQWTIGLEVMLLARDPWRVFITTDHPNAGPFTKYPLVMAWLMSRRAREEEMAKLSRRGLRKTSLPAIDREYTLTEILISTRAAPARILGLRDKGHLGVGAQADIAIYRLNPREVDPSREWRTLVKAFSRAAYTIKDGVIVVKDGEVVEPDYHGRTYYVDVELPGDLEAKVVGRLRKLFPEYYSVSLSNFIIGVDEIRRPERVVVKSSLAG